MKKPLKPVVLIPSTLALALAGFSFSSPSLAQDAPETLEECAAFPDEVERLACYDEVATTTVPDTVEAMKKAKEEQAKQEFGLFTPGLGQQLDRLEVNFVSIHRNPLGKLEMMTNDGQLWVQVDTKRVIYPSQISGRIKKGSIGSYFFTPDTGDRPMKIKRVRKF